MILAKFLLYTFKNNEVLVVVSDDNQLLIADDFYRNEYALYEDTFSEVTIKNYTYQRNFKMSEVIYLQYNNEKLDKFTDGLLMIMVNFWSYLRSFYAK